ncbi:MAG TPA: MerR family DNA-binding transcriptional regulator [Steroidobacteraceae bacterium]|jgi:DNA-binding transcriptional MerR regulator|nr:MerR family DNA-binding transcriptional regulator [Steroidobacteraceae bacterium]HNS27092.1 MerR family DNA-binding transcriptional regulator [Steroidobacteraceae bacterium]
MQIGELAKSAGVPIDTVRYYERQGILPAPRHGGVKKAATAKLAALSGEES